MKIVLMLSLAAGFMNVALASPPKGGVEANKDYVIRPRPAQVGDKQLARFEAADIPVAKPHQYEAAIGAVQEVLRVEGLRQGREAGESDKSLWLVLDHAPQQFDLWQNYRVVEILKTDDRKFSKFAVTTRLDAYNGIGGGWAWHAGKFRYMVYVGEDGKVLAVQKNYYTNLIDFYEWKLGLEEKAAKEKKVLSPSGYSREDLEEARAETGADSAL